jgi:transposase InsO family protein
MLACDFFTVDPFCCAGSTCSSCWKSIAAGSTSWESRGTRRGRGSPSRPATSSSRRGSRLTVSGSWSAIATLSACFDAVFADVGITVLRSPPRAPKTNAYAERWASTIRHECLDRMLIFGHRQLVHVLTEFEAHYNAPPASRSRATLADRLRPTSATPLGGRGSAD